MGNDNLTIHVVDDDDAIRDSLQIWLETEGFEVETFASGDVYLEADRAGLGTILLLDLTLPGRSGHEVLGVLASRQEPPAVIVITSQDDAGLHERVLQAGAKAVLSKPLNHADLLDQIARHSRHT